MGRTTILIVSDDKTMRRLIRGGIKKMASCIIIGECDNGPDAIRYISLLRPDLLFMETELADMTGFDVLESAGHTCSVVFTAASPMHVLRAFDYNTIDYLLKPCSSRDVAAALDKYARWCLKKESGAKNVAAAYPGKMLVENGRRLKSIVVSDITHFKAARDYTRIYTINNEVYLSSYGISFIEKKINPAMFLRIHRSYIVNTAHIRELYRRISGTFIALHNDVEISIGRHYLPSVKQMLL